MVGSHTECQYVLASFGIPADILPIDAEGRFLRPWIEQYIAHRKSIEGGLINSSQVHDLCERIQYPSPADVLLGRGRPFQLWNRHLAKLIEEHGDAYHNDDRMGKAALATSIVKVIQSNGGRFLQRSSDENGWVVVSESVAREKVLNGFRTIRKMQRLRKEPS